MGVFSWMDCCNPKKNIRIESKPCYVLIPEEFGGGHIVEPYYDGYGHFGGKDIFDLVAEWNRADLNEGMFTPEPEKKDFGGLFPFEIEALKKQGMSDSDVKEKDEAAKDRYYQAAIAGRKKSIARLTDYKAGISEQEMFEKYGSEWKRDIGIDIACYDEQNRRLRYPIKITYEESAVYEDCAASDGDPNQGYW